MDGRFGPADVTVTTATRSAIATWQLAGSSCWVGQAQCVGMCVFVRVVCDHFGVHSISGGVCAVAAAVAAMQR